MALNRILNETSVSISNVLVLNKQSSEPRKKIKNNQSNSFSARVRKLARDIYKNRPYVLIELDYLLGDTFGEQEPNQLQEWNKYHHIGELVENHSSKTLSFDLSPVEEGVGYEVPNYIIEEIKAETKLIINFQKEILEGKILNEFHVLSSHGADTRHYRGRPNGVWQLINNESHIGRTFQLLTPSIDGGKPVLICRQKLTSYPTLWEIWLRQKWMDIIMFPEAVKRVLDSGFEPRPLSDKGELTHSSDKQNWSVVYRVLKTHIKNRIKSIGRDFINYEEEPIEIIL